MPETRSADRHAETTFPLRGLAPLRPRIDAYVKKAGGTVTGFLLRAAEEKLDREEAVPGGKPAHAYVQRERGDPEYGCAVCGDGRELHKRARHAEEVS